MSEFEIGREMEKLNQRVLAIEQYLLQIIDEAKKTKNPKDFAEYKKEMEGKE